MATKKSKSICSNEELSKKVQRRDSFQKRVCDDLCEAILQWLPFDEKIKLINVSKQFRRCLRIVCKRQKIIKFTSNDENDENDPNDCTVFVTQLTPKATNNFKKFLRLQNIFQTFPNITSVELNYECEDYIYISDLLDAITYYCDNLESFISETNDRFEPKSILDFAQKFGANIKTLSINYYGEQFDFGPLIEQCTALTSLTFHQSCQDTTELDVLTQVTNLKKLIISIKTVGFVKIIENNNSLTHLVYYSSLRKPLEICYAIEKISQLKDLKYLSIGLEVNNKYDPQMAKSFESIAKNCTKLKCFDLDITPFVHESNAYLSKIDYFNAFKGFSSLEMFNYSDNYDNEYKLNIDCIKNCKQLTRLTLRSFNIPREFFSNIDSVFPHLKKLKAVILDKLTDTELVSMSRLKQLEKLTINALPPSSNLMSITDTGILSLLNECNRLNSFEIFRKTSATEVPINLMIQKAIKNPQMYFKYNFFVNTSDENILEINSKSLNLSNIELKIRN